MRKIYFTKQAEKSYHELPQNIQKKSQKQFKFLLENYRHPSLRTRKMAGLDRFEARIDKHNRFTFILEDDSVVVLSVGPHDVGLGKK